ncbi:hypothetical protein J14TS2_44820 [Bacillus sp. J14TS2]|uniref:2-methylcitrate dehydratase n=1 Tax=Bacillus sp. J14TS2 TaxID=2807188 RepID=UPI001B25D56C|nr:2-methylcitrate dehydratase [Bacillus sp. J14TS2]GIN74007.1 hypothetical protein J14TS2_44820 [Bacillus sp. J14TS2]
MSFVNFKAEVKKVNLKADGKKEVVLEVSDHTLNEKLNMLAEMIDSKVAVELDSMVVNYNVTLNAQTNEPITEYTVDQSGVVEEVKPSQEQLELDTGLPPEKIETKEQKEKVDREQIDNFILEGLAPSYDDLPYDFANVVKRRLEGESYRKLASELEISSGKIVEIVDEYRKRVAPLAQKWAEWKESEGK